MSSARGSDTFERQWRARFQRFAQLYDAEHLVSGWSPTGLRRRVDRFHQLVTAHGLPARARILDLGCGAGTYVRLVAGLGSRPIGLDYSEPTLARAVAADPGRHGRYVAGEAYALPFGDDIFDGVISIGVLQTLQRPEAALDEMVRVLRGGGLLVIEALNARAFAAWLRRMRERLTRTPPRARVYDPKLVRGWLSDRRLDLLHQASIHLPPRRLPALGRLLDVGPRRQPSAKPSVVAVAVAHAFLFVARKRDVHEDTHR